jgi:hypothetical protein
VRLVVVVGLAACSFTRGVPLAGNGSDAPAVGSDAPGAGSDAGRDAAVDAKVFMDAHLDAATCVMATCAALGGTCSAGVCDITAPNNQAVNCPANEKCAVSCPLDNFSCINSMGCPSGADCTFDCTGDHTCEQQPLTCGTGSTCVIYCNSPHACDNFTINCAVGATCTYHCCGGGTSCVTFACNGAGCVDGGATCP